MSECKLKIGITQGDPNGIGWEVILKALSDPRMTELFTPVVYGSPAAAAYYRNTLGDTEPVAFNTVPAARDARRGKANLVACGEAGQPEPGKASPQAGRAAVEALRTATQDLKEGTLDAIVTAPFNKESVQGEDFSYTGHTEFFGAELGGEPMMILCSDVLRVGLVTKHIPVSEISRSISREKIVHDLHTLRRSLIEDFGIVEPRIAVMALNPHAGDGGLLGHEEQEIIRPAIVEAFRQGVLAFGPFAADGLFAGGGYAKYDGILAMYHDQGLAPFKTLSPDGVNFTAGLAKVRTSRGRTRPMRSRCGRRSTPPSTSWSTGAPGRNGAATRCSAPNAKKAAATSRSKTCRRPNGRISYDAAEKDPRRGRVRGHMGIARRSMALRLLFRRHGVLEAGIRGTDRTAGYRRRDGDDPGRAPRTGGCKRCGQRCGSRETGGRRNTNRRDTDREHGGQRRGDCRAGGRRNTGRRNTGRKHDGQRHGSTHSAAAGREKTINTGQPGSVFRLVIVEAPKAPKT